jgi:hypothetical protein
MIHATAPAPVAVVAEAVLPYANYFHVRNSFGRPFADCLAGMTLERRERQIQLETARVQRARYARVATIDPKTRLVLSIAQGD